MMAWVWVFVPLIVNLILLFIGSEKHQTNHTVQASRGIRVLGWLCGLLAAASAIVLLVLHAESRFMTIPAGLAVLALLFLIINASLHINYTKDNFTVRKFFGKPKTYRYEQMEGVILGSGGAYKLVINGKKLLIDEVMEGRLDFLNYAEERYSRKRSASLPMMRESLFNGFIKNPQEILVVLLIVPSLVTALGVYITINEADGIKCPDKLQTIEFTVQNYRILNHASVEMQTSAGSAYLPLRAIPDLEEIERTIREGQKLRASAHERHISKDGYKDYDIWRLSDETGRVFAAENSIEMANEKAYIITCTIIAAVIALSWLVFAGCIRVLNHAPEHPIIMRILVKKEDWNF